MKLSVYKGFDRMFLEHLDEDPLVVEPLLNKKNVLLFNKKTRKKLDRALIQLDDDESAWITYEEYSLIKSRINDAIEEDGLQVSIYRNNLYPEYYPIEFEMDEEVVKEIVETLEGDRNASQSDVCQSFIKIYNSLVNVDGTLFASFYNYEYDNSDSIKVVDFYPQNIVIEESSEQSDYNVFLNEDIETYLRDLLSIVNSKPRIIGLKSTNGGTSERAQRSLQAFCLRNGIRIIRFNERLPEEVELENELIDIAKNDIRVEYFERFRPIKFYKNPDIDKEVVELSQSHIIQEIIRQAENSYDETKGFRDIFITASTGAGKSVMFQVPAVYLAEKYKKLTIIIEPVKALMQDQKEKLFKAGFTRVEAFNSDLITQVEKEAVLARVKSGEIDLLYLSPETLLSYSIETIIGDREIGLIIVDEAHIVTTWGVGFRPDYWYLGSYLNRLRNRIQSNTAYSKKQKVYHFPICAFTATAINGGIDDSVSDTVISLYMENPIKYLGYVRRDDIKFEITHQGTGNKLPKAEYEAEKCRSLDERIQKWLSENEKTIVYFPYASLTADAKRGVRGFAGITTDKRIGTYTGRNIDEYSAEAFNEIKRQTFDGFKNGTIPIIFATKAFGMGVDVNDVLNVYHYAVSGNLCDYVQEIGRAARKKSMTGYAVTDFYYNDMNYMKILFGMSQVKAYQIKKVLEGIYDTYKNKNGSRSFLISPESFTYIFNGKSEGECISKLKICLLMLEKDFYDKYNFKVLVSRPQGVFTKAYICVYGEHEKEVLGSKYGKHMKFLARGRNQVIQQDGSLLSDNGDIYSLNLKAIWENYYPNISFPQFKYWYFNSNSTSKDKVDIMPSIRNKIAPRQKIVIDARGELLLSEIRDVILQDFEYIADCLYTEFRKKFFTIEEFTKIIKERYGVAKAKIIANSIFDLLDPDGHCVKHRNNDKTGKMTYSLANGNFKAYMRNPIIKSKIMHIISHEQGASYEGYISLLNDEYSSTALKLLSIFDYITYEVSGGEEPEIFIRLNDPDKVRGIVMGDIAYSNNYVKKAREKHNRDIAVLLRFFNELQTDEERWNYIEDYFLGYDVLMGINPTPTRNVKMSRAVDKELSYPTNTLRTWEDLKLFFDEDDFAVLEKLETMGIPIPEYLETVIKRSDEGIDILMSWPSKNTLICQNETTKRRIEYFEKKGWHAYRIYDIDYDAIVEALN